MREVQSLVLACLDARDPQAELLRRTADRPQLRSMVQLALARAQSRKGDDRDVAGSMLETIGPYAIVRPLGAGGMGAVYLAEQKEPIARTVALKLVKLGMDTDEVLRRFEVERQTLALMNHDCIARVFDAGKTERGQPYFAMEYVPGIPLTKFADQRALPLAARLDLMLQVCAGVQHAHQRGVIHRDLKPANILVVEQDGRGVPKIIDFGLARATEPIRGDVTQLTVEGTALGTPAYMSPEQAGMGDASVDTRSDVYALGVILYELLCGELPFPAEELLARGPLEMLRLIRDVEPMRPSKKLALRGPGADAVARLRSTTTTTLLRALQRDLDWIVMLALRKERDQRYASVGDLAADLRRFLNDEPVAATAPSAAYRVGKLLRRYRVQAIAAALVLVCLVAGMVVSLVFFFAAERAYTEVKREKDRQDPLVLIAMRQEAENDLWPLHPSRAERMQRWLERAGGLQQRAGLQRAYLAELEAQEAGVRARGSSPSLELTEQIREQRQFLDDLALLQGKPSDDHLAVSIVGVTARLQAARMLPAQTLDAPQAAWREACAAVKASDGVRASELYRGLDLVPQLGLVPLGPDPATKLWEFYHVASGAPEASPPVRDHGHLGMRPELGFVFVLLPGGTFTMGADEAHDPNAEPDEAPRHEVTLAPFFLSKFECTQAQWRRLAGTTPSHYTPAHEMPAKLPKVTWTNPVEQVLWQDVVTACSRVGLVLPTEAQWEYGCRAGATTVFAFGNEPDAMPTFDNVADAFAGRVARGWKDFEPWEDGHVVHAPVGTFAANAFGFYDMHGNVSEMCQDHEWPYGNPLRIGDGLRLPASPQEQPDAGIRVGRGGWWQQNRLRARCADRQEVPVLAASDFTGFRPARPVRATME